MYIAQAINWRHEGWRYLVGTLIIFVLGWQILGSIPISVVSLSKVTSLQEFMEASETVFASLFPPKSNLYFISKHFYNLLLVGKR